MARALPYPGYTWSFTQHAVGIKARPLYNLLKCAAPFEGEAAGYDDKITSLMVASGVLTENIRDGKLSAWRDYQQLLAELGLIHSTTVSKTLVLTDAAQLFLAGEIGFSELIGIQMLRYQYPNGQKWTVQSRQRHELSAAGLGVPESIIELQQQNGVLIKPGTLVLRILLELYRSGHAPELEVSECQYSLLPCKSNGEWPIALSEVISLRGRSFSDQRVNGHSRRNIQDWFKVLGEADFFVKSGNVLRLSEYSLDNLETIEAVCLQQESAESWWVPAEYNSQSRQSWFQWFGNIPYNSQQSLRPDVASNTEYVENNYVGGFDENDEDVLPESPIAMKLVEIDFDLLGKDVDFNFSTDIEALAENLRKGAQKRHAKTLLHDRIIRDLAEKFQSQGAEVLADANSIDLLSTWPDGSSAIFEVKTVTRRSLQGRLRSAVGQVQEYHYRRIESQSIHSDKVIVLNAELSGSDWQTAFLTQHLQIGLICVTTKNEVAFAPQNSSTKNYWQYN